MKRISTYLKNHFGFTQREVNGFFFLCVMMFCLFVGLHIFRNVYISTTENTTTLKEDKLLLDSIVQVLQVQAQEVEQYKKHVQIIPTQLVAFNPNEANAETFQKLSFHPKLAERIIHYREKGGKFRIKSDLKKIYGFPEELYDVVEKYIELPDSLPQRQFKNQYETPEIPSEQTKNMAYTHKKAEIKPFDINLADTTQLQKLSGIGSAFAKRIINFRDKLGGFYSMQQLTEVYGISDIALKELQEKVFIHQNFSPQKIKINQADYTTLSLHPYISGKNASVVVKYRKNHGNFKKPEDLLKTQVITPDMLSKLLPYLDFE